MLLLLAVSCSRAQPAPSFPDTAKPADAAPFSREVYLMGTTLRIEMFTSDAGEANQQMEKIIRTVEAAEEELSNWRESSEISKLNRMKAGEKMHLSPSLCACLTKVTKYVADTDHAFDPAIAALLKSWGFYKEGKIPDTAELTAALSQSGYDNIRMSGCEVEKKGDVDIDAGAFGKGEALDRVLHLAASENFSPVRLNFGGQIAVTPSRENRDWIIDLADPFHRENVSSHRIGIRDGSVSTSGISPNDKIVQGKRIAHILDPRTGLPVEAYGSVTVWSESALEADILSTALYVMGVEKGQEWADKHHVAALFLLDNGASTPTSQFLKMNFSINQDSSGKTGHKTP